jgi:hypothetical protein
VKIPLLAPLSSKRDRRSRTYRALSCFGLRSARSNCCRPCSEGWKGMRVAEHERVRALRALQGAMLQRKVFFHKQ